MNDRGVEWGGQDWPRGSAASHPNLPPHHLPLALPSRDCVGGQWSRMCARSRTLGKLRQQPGLEHGICFTEGHWETGEVTIPSSSTPSRRCLRRGIYGAATTLQLLTMVSYWGLYLCLPHQEVAAEFPWLLVGATDYHAMGLIKWLFLLGGPPVWRYSVICTSVVQACDPPEGPIVSPGGGRRLGGRRSSLVLETVLVGPRLCPGPGWPLSGAGEAPTAGSLRWALTFPHWGCGCPVRAQLSPWKRTWL